MASHLDADYVLVSVGRKSAIGGIDPTALGLAMGPRGEILVDDQQKTNVPGVYAIGDVCGGKLLAHKAEEEGVIAAEVIAMIEALFENFGSNSWVARTKAVK